MIIACPACTTRYVVPDEAIGIDGRTVRCAKCKHNWYQDGPELVERKAELEPEETGGEETGGEAHVEAAAVPEAEPDHTADDNAADEDAADPVDEPAAQDADASADASADEGPAPQPSVSHWRTADGADGEAPHEAADAAEPEEDAATQNAPVAPPIYQEPEPEPAADPEIIDPYSGGDADHSQFDYEPPFRARRNPLKMWTAAGITFAVLAFATIIGVNYWGLPDWVPVERPIFAVEEPDLVLNFPGEQQDRRTLPNGTEYFGASGTITNIGRSSADVPAVLIILRDERNRIVYNWEVVPPQPTLAPGETLTIKEAVTDVPRSAKFAEIGWKSN